MQDSNKETKKQPWRIYSVFESEEIRGSGTVNLGREFYGGVCVYFNTLEHSNIETIEQAQEIAEIIVNALNSQEDEQGN